MICEIFSFLIGGFVASFLISLFFYCCGIKKDFKKLNAKITKKAINVIVKTDYDMLYSTIPYQPDKTYTAEEVRDIQLKVIDKTVTQLTNALVARAEDGFFDLDKD